MTLQIFLPSISSCVTLLNTFWYASLSCFDISGNSAAGTTFGTRCLGRVFGSERPSLILRIKCMARTNSSTLRVLSLLTSARFLKIKRSNNHRNCEQKILKELFFHQKTFWNSSREFNVKAILSQLSEKGSILRRKKLFLRGANSFL